MEAAKEMLRKETCLPLLGPCMLIFALPLLIPGLTLTLVALWDETGFSKFSALHVLGMVLLTCSGLLLLMGLLLHFTLGKKAKGRVRPQPEDEDSIFSSSSSQGSQTMGYVHSTHQTTSVHTEDHTALPDCQVTEPSQPTSQGPEEETDPPSTSVNPALSPRQLLTVGYLPPITSASASRTLPDIGQSPGNRAQTSRVGSGGSVSGNSSQHGSNCNFMLSGSEDEEAQAVRYTALAAKLMTADNGRIKTTSSVSSSSSLSSEEDVEEEASGVEGDPPHSDRRQEFGELPGYKPVISDHRSGALKKEKTSHSSLGHTTDSSSCLEDQASINNEGRQKQLQNPDDGTNRNASAERLFVTRQPASGCRDGPEEHSSDSEDEACPKPNGGVSPRLSTLQENSSSSQCTESPSHGTYSVKSFVSEELVGKASPEEHSAVEDDVFHSSARFLAGSSPGLGRSVSPMPLRIDTNREWGDLGITVLGSRSGGSSQSSPEKSGTSSHSSFQKQSRGADNFHMDSKSEDDVKHTTDSEHSKRKKKKKKKKKKRERLKGEGQSPQEMDRWEEGQVTVEDMEARPYRLSSLRSSRTLQQHPEHHVHWPDD